MDFNLNKGERNFHAGGYYTDGERLYRIISNRVGTSTNYALLNMGTGTIVTNFYVNTDELARHTRLENMNRVTQTNVAQFERGVDK